MRASLFGSQIVSLHNTAISCLGVTATVLTSNAVERAVFLFQRNLALPKRPLSARGVMNFRESWRFREHDRLGGVEAALHQRPGKSRERTEAA